MEENIIKKVSKELGLTYRELAKNIGYTEGNLKSSVSQNRVSKQLRKAIELYAEIVSLKKEIERTKHVKNILKTFINE